jgi:hypothetical protein
MVCFHFVSRSHCLKTGTFTNLHEIPEAHHLLNFSKDVAWLIYRQIKICRLGPIMRNVRCPMPKRPVRTKRCARPTATPGGVSLSTHDTHAWNSAQLSRSLRISYYFGLPSRQRVSFFRHPTRPAFNTDGRGLLRASDFDQLSRVTNTHAPPPDISRNRSSVSRIACDIIRQRINFSPADGLSACMEFRCRVSTWNS